MTKVALYPQALSLELADFLLGIQGGAVRRFSPGSPFKLASVTITTTAVVDGVVITGTATWNNVQSMSINGSAATAANATHASSADSATNATNATTAGACTGNAATATTAAACSGNAATATKLATARNINGTPFDGTADITIAATAVLG